VVEFSGGHHASCSPAGDFGIIFFNAMNEPEEIRRRYRWPWLVLAGVVLWIVSAVIWMAADVKKLERERDFNAPVPANGSTH
jgi:hypothetical protein